MMRINIMHAHSRSVCGVGVGGLCRIVTVVLY